MAPEKAPAFQFYADKFLLDENQAVMSLAQAGAYARLMAYCWREITIPDSPDLARVLVNDGRVTPKQFREMWPLIRACFVPAEEPGRLRHATLDKEREKQAEWREKCANGGKKSAEKRAGTGKGSGKGSSTTVGGVVELEGQLKGNSLVSSLQTTSEVPPNPPHEGGENGSKPKRMTRDERKRAEEVRHTLGGCRHNPPCANYEACLLELVKAWRAKAAAALESPGEEPSIDDVADEDLPPEATGDARGS